VLLFIPRWNEIQQLAADYPVVQMDERLGYERENLDLNSGNSSETVTEGFPTESEVADATGSYFVYLNDRNASLVTLERTHDHFVKAFVLQEGFGSFRMRGLPARDEYIRLPKR